MTKINGLNSLLELFKNHENRERALIEYIIESSYFYPVEVIQKQAKDMLNAISEGQPLYVRTKSIKKEDEDRVFYKVIGDKKYNLKMTESELRKYTNVNKEGADNYVYHQQTGIRVAFDSTGNQRIADETYNYLRHMITANPKRERTIDNYEITHLWGETEHPLFFSSLWNVALVPFVFARLTDKTSSELFVTLSNLLKAISITLYNPENLLNREGKLIEFDTLINDEIMLWARELIGTNAENSKIKFLSLNENQ